MHLVLGLSGNQSFYSFYDLDPIWPAAIALYLNLHRVRQKRWQFNPYTMITQKDQMNPNAK